jgi:hypothetical protein
VTCIPRVRRQRRAWKGRDERSEARAFVGWSSPPLITAAATHPELHVWLNSGGRNPLRTATTQTMANAPPYSRFQICCISDKRGSGDKESGRTRRDSDRIGATSL